MAENRSTPDSYIHMFERSNTLSEQEPSSTPDQNAGPPSDIRFNRFSDEEVKRKFIAKVYAIVGIQLLITSIIAGVIYAM